MERILVCGGRDFDDGHCVFRELNGALEHYGECIIIQGGANGADNLARQWALSRGICCIQVDAPWDKFGKSAGAIRNAWMLQYCAPTIVIAFPGGSGTANMCKLARAAGLPVYVIA